MTKFRSEKFWVLASPFLVIGLLAAAVASATCGEGEGEVHKITVSPNPTVHFSGAAVQKKLTIKNWGLSQKVEVSISGSGQSAFTLVANYDENCDKRLMTTGSTCVQGVKCITSGKFAFLDVVLENAMAGDSTKLECL
jgi:hypothetical protein